VTVLRDIMSTRVSLTTPDTSVAEAAAGMVSARVGSAIVMQGRFLAGILTERDVLRAAASGESLVTARVTDWISRGPAVTAAEAVESAPVPAALIAATLNV